MEQPKHIIISRTDSIGDVILTLPLTGIIKEKYPNCKISFIGRTYTKSIIELSANVDAFINWDDYKELNERDKAAKLKGTDADWIIHVFPNKEIAKAAKKARIKKRVGTSHRTVHLLSCNHRVSFSRKKSDKHEAQLNVKLLLPLGILDIPSTEELSAYYGYPTKPIENSKAESYIKKDKKNIILHPKSQGSAREWGLDNFSKLINLLNTKKYHVIISGTEGEAKLMTEFLKKHKHQVSDLTGKLSLWEYISLISQSQALIAASTGPLHIAAALGIKALGLFAPMRPIHPGRWKPIGIKAKALVIDKECSDCRASNNCECIRSIQAEIVAENL